MSTNPGFVAQDDTNYSAVRFYTEFDPYYYAIDNRPLQDLEANIKADRRGGPEAARRAAMLGSLNMASVMQDLYSVPATSLATRAYYGLKVTLPSTNLIQITPGAVYESRAVSISVSDVIMKQALSTKVNSFTLTPPVTVGTSIVYTIEGQFTELTTTNLGTTNLPNLDPANPFLPSTLIHGELVLSMVAGVAAATGSQVAATTTVGKFPLYNLTSTQGVTNPTVTAHPNAPYSKGLSKNSTPIPLPTGGATLNIANELQAFTFADAVTSGVILPTENNIKSLNPYVPVRVGLVMASSAASGNLALRVRYKGFQSGEAYTVAGANSPTEAIAVVGALNTIQTTYTSVAVIPNTEFAGFVGGLWTVNKDKLSLVLERLGADTLDTNAGVMSLFNVVLFQ